MASLQGKTSRAAWARKRWKPLHCLAASVSNARRKAAYCGAVREIMTTRPVPGGHGLAGSRWIITSVRGGSTGVRQGSATCGIGLRSGGYRMTGLVDVNRRVRGRAFTAVTVGSVCSDVVNRLVIDRWCRWHQLQAGIRFYPLRLPWPCITNATAGGGKS